MKSLLGLLIVAVLVFGAAPALSQEAVHVWSCELEDDVSEDSVDEYAEKWLAAAKKVEGGANLKAYVYFPIAGTPPGDGDVLFVVVAPSFAEWGKFWDNYDDSEAADIEDMQREFIACPDSALWESFKISK